MGRRWIGLARGRVNPLVPAAVAAVGIGLALSGRGYVGAGVAVGAALGYLNGLILSRRVDLAALSGDMAAAMMVMQVGLLVTLGMVGVATIVLIKISVAMAVASAAGFAATHLGILAAFYWVQGRRSSMIEQEA